MYSFSHLHPPLNKFSFPSVILLYWGTGSCAREVNLENRGMSKDLEPLLYQIRDHGWYLVLVDEKLFWANRTWFSKFFLILIMFGIKWNFFINFFRNHSTFTIQIVNNHTVAENSYKIHKKMLLTETELEIHSWCHLFFSRRTLQTSLYNFTTLIYFSLFIFSTIPDVWR